MKLVKKLVALGTAVMMLGSSSLAHAAYCSDTGGCGYSECRRSPCLAPAIALGTIALVAIIAVAVQNSSSSSHSH